MNPGKPHLLVRLKDLTERMALLDETAIAKSLSGHVVKIDGLTFVASKGSYFVHSIVDTTEQPEHHPATGLVAGRSLSR